jgi:hypothetical protein
MPASAGTGSGQWGAGTRKSSSAAVAEAHATRQHHWHGKVPPGLAPSTIRVINLDVDERTVSPDVMGGGDVVSLGESGRSDRDDLCVPPRDRTSHWLPRLFLSGYGCRCPAVIDLRLMGG